MCVGAVFTAGQAKELLDKSSVLNGILLYVCVIASSVPRPDVRSSHTKARVRIQKRLCDLSNSRFDSVRRCCVRHV